MTQKIDKSKTYDLCYKAWRKAQMDNGYRFIVPSPVYVGEDVNYDDIRMETFSTIVPGAFMSFDIQGFDTVEGSIDFSECDTDSLREELGIDFEYIDDLEDGTVELTEEQKEIFCSWKDEQVDAELDSYWEDYSAEFYNLVDEAIEEWEVGK